jgi:hypothetical protein
MPFIILIYPKTYWIDEGEDFYFKESLHQKRCFKYNLQTLTII